MGLDCYASADRALMQKSQRARGAFLTPLLRLLTRAGLRAGHVTAASLLTGLAFVPLFLLECPRAALGALLVHVLLDGIDGPLARHQGRAAAGGAFADAFCDQLVVATTTVALVFAGRAGVLPGFLFVLAYSVVIVFALVRNALRIPYGWLIRPRFAFYAWIAVDLWLAPGTLGTLLALFGAPLAWKVLTGFVRIHRALGA